MPRPRRLWEPGSTLSILDRADEGRPIFVIDADRRYFAPRLTRVLVASDVDLLAWTLLIHHHFVIRAREAEDVPRPVNLFTR